MLVRTNLKLVEYGIDLNFLRIYLLNIYEGLLDSVFCNCEALFPVILILDLQSTSLFS